MPRIEWDKTGERLYETGVDRGVLFVYDPEKSEYKPGVAWNGLTTVTESPSGAEPNAIYADNIKYLELTSREEFGGTIEAYTYPEEFSLCDGSFSQNGVSIAQQARRQFAFSYRTKVGNDTLGDDYGYKLHIVFGAKAQPSEKTRSTVNDTPEATTMSWTFTTTPPQLNEEALPEALKGKLQPTAHITIDSTKVDPEILKKIEDSLYDDANFDPATLNPAYFVGQAVGDSGNVEVGDDPSGNQ